MRILIVEDEIRLSEALEEILKQEKYTVDTAHDGESGLYDALSGIYDLILLDIMLPKMDGIAVLRRLRKEGISTPVIMLTAKGEVSDKVQGLDSGADDYIVKPFAMKELLARVRAASRRRGDVPPDATMSFGDIKLDPGTLVVSTSTKEIKLNLKEKELLELMILRCDAVTPKDYIIEKIWGFDSDAGDNHVEVYVSFLRKKLAFLESNVGITTIRGVGYRLEEKGDV